MPTSRVALVLCRAFLPRSARCRKLLGTLEIAKMRSEGATQAEIDRMLDEFEEAPDEDAEGKLVVAVLRQAARLPS